MWRRGKLILIMIKWSIIDQTFRNSILVSFCAKNKNKIDYHSKMAKVLLGTGIDWIIFYFVKSSFLDDFNKLVCENVATFLSTHHCTFLTSRLPSNMITFNFEKKYCWYVWRKSPNNCNSFSQVMQLHLTWYPSFQTTSTISRSRRSARFWSKMVPHSRALPLELAKPIQVRS